MQRDKERIPELDGLRGIAISLVVLYHYFYFGPDANHHPQGLVHQLYVYLERYIALGWTGVDLFFVLSGFLIGGILLNVRTSPRYFKVFYLRRLFRIVPVYYAWIMAYLLTIVLAGPFLREHMDGNRIQEGRYQILALFLFLQNFGLRYPSVLASAWFVPTWSLAVEEQFYLVSPLAIRLLSKRNLCLVLVAVIFSAPLLRIWLYYHLPPHGADLSLAYTLMPCRADALAMGILAALLWRSPSFPAWLSANGRLLYGVTALFLVGVFALGAWFPSQNSLQMQSVGYTWIAMFYFLVLLLSLVKPTGPVAAIARIKGLCELGRVSYCLYLIHAAVRIICQIVLTAIYPVAQTWQLVSMGGIAAVLAYLIARISWTYFERPLLHRGHAYRY